MASRFRAGLTLRNVAHDDVKLITHLLSPIHLRTASHLPQAPSRNDHVSNALTTQESLSLVSHADIQETLDPSHFLAKIFVLI